MSQMSNEELLKIAEDGIELSLRYDGLNSAVCENSIQRSIAACSLVIAREMSTKQEAQIVQNNFTQNLSTVEGTDVEEEA